MTIEEELVQAYLLRLHKAARALPKTQRVELVADIEGHIAEARQQGSGEAYVLNVLDALGDPAAIVAAMTGPTVRSDPGARDVVTVLLILLGGVVLPVVGWLAGLVLLWSSRSWTIGRKALATLVWPGGLAPVLLMFTGVIDFSVPIWFAYVCLAVAAGGPIVVAVDLLRHVRAPQLAPAGLT